MAMIETVNQRSAGVLLHPTSLPSRFAIGDLGPGALAFLEFMNRARLGVWQVLPVGPPGPGDSPYSSHSAFAGHVGLISPELLVEDRLLEGHHVEQPPVERPAQGLSRLADWKNDLVARALTRLTGEPLEGFDDFRIGSAKPGWLDDWTLYSAIKRRLGGRPWYEWPSDLRHREPASLAAARLDLEDSIRAEAFAQYLFLLQWRRLRSSAHSRGISLLGDLPIYAALDSADVWSRRDVFRLDGAGRPLAVAGVPPDYFSTEGQLWGHPLYDWHHLRSTDYEWWVERVRWQLTLFDSLRIDHFRGLVSFWEVPGSASTARDGKWVEGPGADLFAALKQSLGTLPLVAEDLGVESPEVDGLRRQLGLPGMKVLQFAFEEIDSSHLPHHYSAETVVYTGTHDNDTSVGWFQSRPDEVRQRFQAYAGSQAVDVPWDLIRLAWNSVARLAIVPMQDILGLGPDARMNTPGLPEGNWGWQLETERFETDSVAAASRLAEMTILSGRARDHEES